MAMASVQRKKLSELNFEIKNAVVIALVIGKTEARTFVSKNDGDERGVLMVTIRDSVRDFVNCKIWASRCKIEEYDHLIHIGSIVEIKSPKVCSVTAGIEGGQYNPSSSLPLMLVVNEGIGEIKTYQQNVDIIRQIKFLATLPVKPPESTLNLADVHTNCMQMSGQHIDLLVLVKSVKNVRSIQTRSADCKRCLDVIVIDRSFTSGVLLTIWHPEWIERAQLKWEPLKTILQLVDVRVNFSQFYKSTVLGLSNKTLVIENPRSRESQLLLNFSNSVGLTQDDTYNHAASNLPSVLSITCVMTVAQIYDRANGALGDENDEFSAVLYAMVTKFDLDGQSFVIAKRCKFCRKMIPSTKNQCEAVQCQMNLSLNSYVDPYEFDFNINVHLTDHTGTITECRLTNQFAESTLGYSVTEFQHLTTKQKISLKWKFLLERCSVKMVVKKKTVTRSNLVVILMEMKPVDIQTVSEKILVY